MPAGGTARPKNGERRRGPERKARASTRRSQDFDTELFLTTVGTGKTIATYRPKSYVFRQGTNRFVGEIDLDAFARYIEFLGTVNPGPQNRITLVP